MSDSRTPENWTWNGVLPPDPSPPAEVEAALAYLEGFVDPACPTRLSESIAVVRAEIERLREECLAYDGEIKEWERTTAEEIRRNHAAGFADGLRWARETWISVPYIGGTEDFREGWVQGGAAAQAALLRRTEAELARLKAQEGA